MGNWICLIGASERGARAIKSLGYEFAVITVPQAIPSSLLEFARLIMPVSSYATEAVRISLHELVKLLGLPCAIVSFTELGLLPAAELSVELGLPTNNPDVIEATRNKYKMRVTLNGNKKLYVPCITGGPDDIVNGCCARKEEKYVVKPIDGYGSQQIHLLSSPEDLECWRRDHTEGQWLAEPYVNGPEYSVEAVTFGGQHLVLGITEKETTGNRGFIEIGHSFPACLSPERAEEIKAVVCESLSTLGVQVGASHTEVIYDMNRGPVIIETHTRPGGDCIPELVELSCGLDQYRLAIESLFCSEPSQDIKVCYTRGAAISFFECTPGYLSGIHFEAHDISGIVRLNLDAQVGTEIPAMRDSFSRPGYVICTGVDSGDAKKKSKSVVSQLRFQVKPLDKGVDRCQ
ncbi:ATP-grasp domain-containing protein [Alicyclobacillus sendaiensis]|uniref:ATP-grasp domain-containing protein n=1 Tax=Alicyclobacillus sendaiensis TaxID=192387 RepID=UPI0026F452BD|nr:ATP-grasp domain-containing protein [Alicyclobacillus sendaiensis]